MRKRSDLGLANDAVVPRDETERVVAAAFAEFLGLDLVGVEDELFALGGDSFVALRIALALEERLQASLDASQVADCGTVRRLCATLRRGG
jgi:acyl carrier protein